MSADVNWLDKALEWGWTAVGAGVVWLARRVSGHIKEQEAHDKRITALETSDKQHLSVLMELKQDILENRHAAGAANDSIRADIRILTETLLKKS